MSGLREKVFFCLSLAFCALFLISGCATQARQQRLKEASAHYKLGVAHLDAENIQRAFVSLQTAKGLNPRDRDTRYALGHIYYLQKKYDQAEKEFKKTLKIDPRYSQAQNYLGKVYERTGQFDKAILAYRAALRNPLYLTPDLAYYNLGAVFRAEGRFDEAVEEFQEAIRINPDHVLAYYHLAYTHIESGDYVAAVAVYQEILQHFPDSPVAHYRLAWAYLRNDAQEQAVSEFSTVLEAFPESPQAGRSRNHLNFLQSTGDKLRLGMTDAQVLGVLGADAAVEMTRETEEGTERWFLHSYDLVLHFESGRYTGYYEGPQQ